MAMENLRVHEEHQPAGAKLTDDQITTKINAAQLQDETASDTSIVYNKAGQVFDMRKKALYGIKPIQTSDF